MTDFTLWGGAVVAFLVAIAAAFGWGKSKGKMSANEQQAKADVVAAQAAAERQTSVSKEAAHVDQTVNNSSDSDIDSQLRNKWTRK